MAARTIRHPVRVVLLVMATAVCILPLHRAPRAELLQGEDPHAHFQKPEYCSRCHLLAGGKPAPDRFDADADSFCLECHRNKELGRSHPRGMRPKDLPPGRKGTEEFRLDDRGRILCMTCHKGHGSFLSTVKAFPRQMPERLSASRNSPKYRTYYLRSSDPVLGFAPLCRRCHPHL